MSAFTSVTTQIKDLGCIKKTLMKMGWAESEIEVHDKPVKLNGFHGSENRTAHVVVRKKNLRGGAQWNDLGFLKQEDGTIKVVGEYAGKWGNITGKRFTQGLIQNYAHVKLEEELEASGFFIDQVENRDGKIYVTAENPYL